MLVLTQKEGEVLQLGDDIRIYIKRVKGNMVRLCIDAPREVQILRVPAKTSKRPQDRSGEGTEDPGIDSLGLDLRSPGEPLAQGEATYPGEGVPSEDVADDTDSESPVSED